MKCFDSYTTPSTFLIIAIFSGLIACATIEINILKLNYVFLLYCAQLYLTILLQYNNLIDTQLAINALYTHKSCRYTFLTTSFTATGHFTIFLYYMATDHSKA